MGDDIGLGVSSMAFCFDFCSTNVVQLSNWNLYFYQFRCHHPLKFIHSEKATQFCKISTLLLSNVVPVKSRVEILQNFVAFSEHMIFIVVKILNHHQHPINLRSTAPCERIAVLCAVI